MGLAGAALIVSGGRIHVELHNLAGYTCAGAAALSWAAYSLLIRRLPPFPTEAVGGFCLLSGMLSLSLYAVESALTGQFMMPAEIEWVLLAGLGAGPMGLAFFTWSAALKRGDPRVIGALSYLTPLASTLVLVALGNQPFTVISALAMLLIIAGAFIGSFDMLRR
ncbi:MAG: DMT family transporter, partial [Anaerolineae bacterium]|nr:DMT family transporter [Thermoflexales bacterium]MDW8408828.1 DMT family transporter [Anaerolineae bacterium]